MKDILLRNVPPELHRAIRIGAAIQGLTMSEFILEVVGNAPKVRVIAVMTEDIALEEGREGEDGGR